MPHSYEIRPREANEHRGPRDGNLGFYELLIDGIPTDYMMKGMQAFRKMLKRALAEGKSPAEAPARAMQLCEKHVYHALNRMIQRIKEGRLVPGGIPMTPDGGLDTEKLLATVSPEAQEEIQRRKRLGKDLRVSEADAVQLFTNRGRLKGLTLDDRKRIAAHRNERRDHTADWHARRATLIAKADQDLADLLEEKKRNPDKAHKIERDIVALRNRIRELKAPVLAASHGFQFAYGEYFNADTDLVAGDIRIVPCMTNTTVDTERDAKDQVSDFTTLDEFDGSGYSTGGQALDNQAVNIDDANDRAEFDADDEAATLGAGTRSIQGNLLIEFISTLNGSLPLHWIEYAANKTPDGSLFTIQFNAEGILQAADG